MTHSVDILPKSDTRYCTVCGEKMLFQIGVKPYAFGSLTGKPLYKARHYCPKGHQTGIGYELHDMPLGTGWIVKMCGSTNRWLVSD